MGSLDRLHLRWNDYEANVKSGFSELRKEEELFDITLAVGSQQIKAHKVILSACSPFFRSLIKSVPHQHPLLYLRGIQPRHLESLLCFIYNGEVNITADDLGSLLSVAEDLQIKGLTRHLKAQESGPSSSSSSSPAKRTRLDAESRIPANKHLLEDEDSLDEDERKGNHDKMEALDDPGSEDEDSLDNYSSTNDPISLVSSEYYGMYDESGLMDPESGDGSSFRAPNFSDNYIKSKEKAVSEFLSNTDDSVLDLDNLKDEDWAPLLKNSVNKAVWLMFDVNKDKTMHRCRACLKHYAANSSPTTFKRHLRKCRNGAFYRAGDQLEYAKAARRGEFSTLSMA